MDHNANIYYETSSHHTMPTYSFFIDKLKQLQKLSRVIGYNDLSTDIANCENDSKPNSCSIPNQSMIRPVCHKCRPKKFYRLGNIVWPSNIKHKMQSHQQYPSDYFIRTILNTRIINNYIINPPIQIEPSRINRVSHIPLHYNKLLIIDALMHQGSFPRYENNGRYIYSEHSGVITIKNNSVNNIIVSAETNRMDVGDENIYLPINSSLMAKHRYLFHTHPNTIKYAGRINEGIIYEFPSANDIFNFVKFHDGGKVQASLIIAPEGIYVIRPITFGRKYQLDRNFFYFLRKFILKLERIAMKKVKKIPNISRPAIFHRQIGMDFRYIRIYNKFLEPHNLFIEYYPREKKNGEWCLKQINLVNVA